MKILMRTIKSFGKKKNLNLDDEKNVLYVALTRAKK